MIEAENTIERLKADLSRALSALSAARKRIKELENERRGLNVLSSGAKEQAPPDHSTLKVTPRITPEIRKLDALFSLTKELTNAVIAFGLVSPTGELQRLLGAAQSLWKE